MAKGDSAASKHYFHPEDKTILKNLISYTGPPVTLPDIDQLAPSK